VPSSEPARPAAPAQASPSPRVAAVARRPATPPPTPPASAAVQDRIVRVPAAEPEPKPSWHLAVPGQPPAPTEEVVRVSIGRIEVRTTPPATPPAAPVPLARPRQSLDDYLAARDRGRR
jgi:hypothetical protein